MTGRDLFSRNAIQTPVAEKIAARGAGYPSPLNILPRNSSARRYIPGGAARAAARRNCEKSVPTVPKSR